MTPRRPRPASECSSLPTLGALLASPALLAGCHGPVCGGERVDELRAHAPDASRALRQGELSSAARDIAVALGLTAHTSARREGLQVAGAAPVVQPPPPPVEPPPVAPPPRLDDRAMPGQFIRVRPDAAVRHRNAPIDRSNPFGD